MTVRSAEHAAVPSPAACVHLPRHLQYHCRTSLRNATKQAVNLRYSALPQPPPPGVATASRSPALTEGWSCRAAHLAVRRFSPGLPGAPPSQSPGPVTAPFRQQGHRGGLEKLVFAHQAVTAAMPAAPPNRHAPRTPHAQAENSISSTSIGVFRVLVICDLDCTEPGDTGHRRRYHHRWFRNSPSCCRRRDTHRKVVHRALAGGRHLCPAPPVPAHP